MTEGDLKIRAIVVGVGKYRQETNAEYQIQSAPACDSAARAIVDFLLNDARFSPQEIVLLDTMGDEEAAGELENAVDPNGRVGPIEYRGIPVRLPTENNVKELFEGGIDRLSEADPLFFYWCGHGSQSQAGGGSRHLFFSDSSKANWRNLKWESLQRRLESRLARFPSLVSVVDACCVSTPAVFWPSGEIVGGPPRTGPPLSFLALFSTGPGEAAAIYAESELPIYTKLLLNHLTASSNQESLFDRVEAAHTKVTEDLGNLQQLADKFGLDARALVRQIPYEILQSTPTSRTSFRPEITVDLLAANIERFEVVEVVAKQWVSMYKALGADFASRKSQRQLLLRWRQRLADSEQLGDAFKSWWAVGETRDRRDFVRSAGIAALAVVAVLACALLLLVVPAKSLIARLREKDSVLEVWNENSWAVRKMAAWMLPSVVKSPLEARDKKVRQENARQKANGALALLISGDPSPFVWLANGEGEWYDPQARSFAILNALREATVPPVLLWKLLQDQSLSPLARQAVILALGAVEVFPPELPRDEIQKLLLRDFEQHDDSGVHAACAWILMTSLNDSKTSLQLQAAAKRLREKGINRLLSAHGKRHWYIDEKTGLTMVVVLAQGVEGRYGDRDGLKESETLVDPCGPQKLKLKHSFAISMTEVNHDHMKGAPSAEVSTSPAVANEVSRVMASQYCREMPQGPYKVQIERQSYNVGPFRLPHELEWEYACRAGSISRYSFGDDKELLPNFGTIVPNSRTNPRLMSKMPNDWGLFDFHGGVAEWCSNDFVPFPPSQNVESLNSSQGVFRGGDGSTTGVSSKCTSFHREFLPARSDALPCLGFRVVVTFEKSP